ncbi:MAG: hypothetical protein GKC10_01530 [Methanosarcinales archaeon]|nr:hypothetical protein [Methanosarcinales archaeon]
MDFELHPAVSLKAGTFNLLIAPESMLAGALKDHLELQRYKMLYVCGNYSRILTGLDRRFRNLEVRRAFTAFQLLTVLEEAGQTIVLVEHDPTLYEDLMEMADYVARALKDAAARSLVLLYSPASDPFLEEMARLADRAFFFSQPPQARRPGKSRRTTTGQSTLEAF